MAISDDDQAAFVADATAFAPKVTAALAAAHSRHQNSAAVAVLHDQFNTIAVRTEDLTGQPRGTFGGVDGVANPDTGGTGKGAPDGGSGGGDGCDTPPT